MCGLIFLTLSPFVSRDYERFGIDILRKNFDVHIFDMTALYRPDFAKTNILDIHHFDGYHSIDSLTKFLLLINQLSISGAVDFLDISRNSFFVRKKLKEKGVLLTKVLHGLQPKVPEPPTSSKIAKQIFVPAKWRNLFFSIHKALRPQDFFGSDNILVGGLAGESLVSAKYSKEIIHNHSFDYDIYLKLESFPKVSVKSFAVFIDQYYVSHPDLKFLGYKPFVTEEKYYGSLENFFKDFEAKTGLNVVIAAHPRSRYGHHNNIFGDRPLCLGKTAELIRDSSFVLLHQSNSVSYAVLWKKKIAFLTTDEINNSFMVKSLTQFCDFFGRTPINLDNYSDKQLNNELKEPLDEVIYKNYTDQFLRYPGSPQKYCWEIYSEYMQQKLIK
jgi:hypothetical protein